MFGCMCSWLINCLKSSSVTIAHNNSPPSEQSHMMEAEEHELTENVDTLQSTRNGNIRMNMDSSRENDAVDPGCSICRHFRKHESMYVLLSCIGEKTIVLLICAVVSWDLHMLRYSHYAYIENQFRAPFKHGC